MDLISEICEGLTAEQREAAIRRAPVLLVSAAAGAGKTSVLVKRVLARVANGENNIDDFLLITFTKAAAGEMRARIVKELTALAAKHLEIESLRPQLTRALNAKICTLHALSAEILRENAALAGFPSGFRVMDDTERSVMESRVLEDTLDLLYEEADPDFLRCAEVYGDTRGDRRLAAMLADIYQKTRARKNPVRWLEEEAEQLLESPERWAKELLAGGRGLCEALLELYNDLASRLSPDSLSSKQAVAFPLEREALETLCAVFNDWENAGKALRGFELMSLTGTRGGMDDELKNEYAILRKKLKQCLDKLKNQIYGTLELHAEINREAYPALAGLCVAFSKYHEALEREKARLKTLDFSDIIIKTLELLRPDGKPGALAELYAGRFAEILVDEYQDINTMQDDLISALAGETTPVFYVGDVRQSIYRFQLAEPELFLSRFRALPDYRSAKPGESCKILLTRNFRSRPEILEAVNSLFSRIGCPEMGVLKREEYMVSAKEAPPDGDCKTELLIYEEPDSDDDETLLEAQAVAARLAELISSGAYKPEDCAVIMRSAAKRLPVFRKALEDAGIECTAPGGEDYFNRAEILILRSLLELCGNAYSDIPLLAALQSPAVGCSPDEIATLRADEHDEFPGAEPKPLYALAAKSGNLKIKVFCMKLDIWRILSAEMTASGLCARILADTGLPGLYSGLARENLMLFPEVLRSFPYIEPRKLTSWINKQADEMRSPERIEPARSAVELLTIHRSKGLEYPLVVVAGLSKPLNLTDLNSRLLSLSRAGLGPRCRDGNAEFPTIAFHAVRQRMDAETRAEELRLLYVAMTRAKEKLILSVGKRSSVKGNGLISPSGLRLENSVAAWIWRVCADSLIVTESGKADSKPTVAVQEQKRVIYKVNYEHNEAPDFPAKLTATGLKGRYIELEITEDAKELGDSTAPPVHSAPAFRSPDFSIKKLTSAERGTAIHSFMQYADFARISTPDGVEAELVRLVESSRLTSEQADCVDKEAIVRFGRSALAGELLSNNTVREHRFSVMLQNRDIKGITLPDGEKILLQGIIDAFYIKDGEIHLVDFKTDRVKSGAEREHSHKYLPQLEAYVFALENMYNLPVLSKRLYYFATGAEVSIW